MSLSEEKLLILKMLEEGKITSEEAVKLLDALENNTKQTETGKTSRNQKNTNFQDEAAKMREKVNEWRKSIKDNYNQKDFDNMVDDFSSKAEKLGKTLANTTFGIADKVIDFVGSFVDTSAFNIFGHYKAIDKAFEAIATENTELEIVGVNGSITVKKHLEDKIIIRSRVKSPSENVDDILVFEENGTAVTLKLLNTGNISVSHEVFLPAIHFSKIKFETTNGKIYVEDSLSEQFEAITRNAHIELMGVNSNKISLNTKNAKVQIGYVIGRNIDIVTNNSVIDLKHIKAENINAVTKNGRILVENAQNHENSEQLNMNLQTTNSGIKVNMSDMDNRAYKVKGKTTNGGINLLIPEMTYHNVNKQGIGGSFVEAETMNYSGSLQRVYINAETQNGYIEIVK